VTNTDFYRNKILETTGDGGIYGFLRIGPQRFKIYYNVSVSLTYVP
jgi:hypothetical protein